MPPAVLREVYPRMEDFAELRTRVDPADKFANPFLDRCFAQS